MANLLSACLEAHVDKFVFSSSAIVYGAQNTTPIPEAAPLRPSNPYTRTKLACEQILQDVMRARSSFHACSLRYFNPIGNHPSGRISESPKSPPSNLFPNLVAALRDRGSIEVFGNDCDTPDGSAMRDFIHVVDVAEGHAAALAYLQKASIGQSAMPSVFNLSISEPGEAAQ